MTIAKGLIEPILNIGVEDPDCEFSELGLVSTTLLIDINHNMILFLSVLFKVCLLSSIETPHLFFRVLHFVPLQRFGDMRHWPEGPDNWIVHLDKVCNLPSPISNHQPLKVRSCLFFLISEGRIYCTFTNYDCLTQWNLTIVSDFEILFHYTEIILTVESVTFSFHCGS